MAGSLAFDFPDLDVVRERRSRDRVAGTGVAWLVVAPAEEITPIARMLTGENGYKHFFVASRNGRRCVSEGDLVLLATRPASSDVELFMCGARAEDGQAKRLRALVASAFETRSVALHSKVPVEMLVVGFSPFGRRRRRRQESRTMLERTFDSLQCKEILGNPYMKERLSRTILDAAPKPIDPLVNAIFSRLRADGLLGVQRWADIDMNEAASLYQSAKADFQVLELKAQAAECARRLRMVRDIERAKGPDLFPGLEDPDQSARSLSDLGFVAKRCVTARIEFDDDEFKDMTFERRQRGTSRSMGPPLLIKPADMLSVLAQLEDPISIPVVEAGTPSQENGALMFDLKVRIRQRFAAGLGFDVPLLDSTDRFRDGLLGVSGRTCKQVGHPTEVADDGTANVKLAATRPGTHRIQLRVSEGLISRQFAVTFHLDSSCNE